MVLLNKYFKGVNALIYFTREKVSPSMHRIHGFGDVCTYFVEGKDRGLLIDTGYGIWSLRNYLDTITYKPYDVWITHGHLDHVGGAGEFEQVYMPAEDIPLATEHISVAYRKNGLTRFSEEILSKITPEDFIKGEPAEYLPLVDGQTIDLGGVVLKAIQVPGHTHGIVAVLNETDSVLMTGDACGVGVLICLDESLPAETYLNSLKSLKETYKGQYHYVLREHGTNFSTNEVVDDCIAGCEKILARTDAKLPETVHGKTVYRVFPISENTGMRVDGREGNILYDENKIFE